MNRKSRRVVMIVLVIIFVSGLMACNSNKDNDMKDTSKKSAFESSDNEQNQIDLLEIYKEIGNNKYVLKNKTLIGEIEGYEIYAEELELLVIMGELKRPENKYKDAFETLKIKKKEIQLAEKYNILFTEENIIEFISLQKETIAKIEETDSEMEGFFQKVFEAIQMTEEEYYSEFLPPRAEASMIHWEVDKYLRENDEEPIDNSKIEYEIYDEKYKELIED